MKRILTSFGSFCTGDDIARATSRYSLALARTHDTDTVDIPFLAGDGTIQRIEMRIGWLVDIAVAEERAGEVEVVEPQTVRDMDERTDAVAGRLMRHEGDGFSWDYDL
jgi:hypothetical protein